MADLRNQRGFTLVELLVVLVILGLLVGLVGPRVMRYLGSSKADAAVVQIEQLATSLDLYILDLGALPSTEEGLEALVKAPVGAEGWNGPYLRKGAVPLDPWGAPYVYAADVGAGSFTLTTLGADGVEGGSGENADITR